METKKRLMLIALHNILGATIDEGVAAGKQPGEILGEMELILKEAKTSGIKFQ